MPRVDS